MVYDPRLCNQWHADAIKAAVTVISEMRTHEGFEGRYVSHDYIKQCIIDDILVKSIPAGVA
jgi:hypothetical protein